MTTKQNYILNVHMTWKVTRCCYHCKETDGSTCLVAWKYSPWFDYSFTWDWCELHVQIQYLIQTRYIYLWHIPSNDIPMQCQTWNQTFIIWFLCQGATFWNWLSCLQYFWNFTALKPIYNVYWLMRNILHHLSHFFDMNMKIFCTIHCSDTQNDLERKDQFVLYRSWKICDLF